MPSPSNALSLLKIRSSAKSNGNVLLLEHCGGLYPDYHVRMLKPGPNDLNFSRLSVRLTVVLLSQGFQNVSELERMSDKELLSLERIDRADVEKIRAELSRLKHDGMLQ